MEFPSPFGELSSLTENGLLKDWGGHVSVPFRGTVFLNQYYSKRTKEIINKFPSPFGELSSLTYERFVYKDEHCTVSVPFRGTVFLNLMTLLISVFVLVSVPFRGTVFLNLVRRIPAPSEHGFRPLSGNCLP